MQKNHAHRHCVRYNTQEMAYLKHNHTRGARTHLLLPPAGRILTVLALLAMPLALGLLGLPARAQTSPAPQKVAAPEVTDAQVRRAIDLAVERLKAGQKADGHWQVVSNRYGGMTALAVLALLQAGEPLDDPVVARGLAALEKLPDVETYVASLRLMALLKVEEITGRQRYARQISAAVRWLEAGQSKLGSWGYDHRWMAADPEGRTSTDHSNSQFALLALYEASRAGYKVQDVVWKRAQESFLKTQLKDGSWNYGWRIGNIQGMPGYGSMTAAGIASLHITGARLHEGADYACGSADRERQAGEYLQSEPVARGLAWLEERFAIDRHPGRPAGDWHFYYLYAIERVGIITGRQRIGGRDWFREGAALLVNRQRADGSFGRGDSSGGVLHEYDTALAILFLAKGHVPALLGKLRWSDDAGQWNVDRYAAENFTRWIGDRLSGSPVGWRVVTLQDSLVDLRGTPLLYFAGREAPKLTSADKALLRSYVDQGGTILADANCGNADFTAAMRKLAADLWPEAPLERLPAEHPVYHTVEELPASWRLEGVTNGCRTVFFLTPNDLGCYWEQARREDSAAGLKMGLNIAAYATGGASLPPPLAPVELIGPQGRPQVDRGTLLVGKIIHQGDWNSRPHAVDELLKLAGRQMPLRLADRATPVRLTDENLGRYPLLVMCGHRDPKLSAEEKAALGRHLQRGGFLLAEACCGRKEFDQAVHALLAEVLPDAPLEPIPLDDPLFSAATGNRIEGVSYSETVRRSEPGLNEPRLYGVRIGDRYAAIYSPYALGPGLDGVHSWQSRAVADEDARRLAENILLYALKF